jgi:hypothetical protein
MSEGLSGATSPLGFPGTRLLYRGSGVGSDGERSRLFVGKREGCEGERPGHRPWNRIPDLARMRRLRENSPEGHNGRGTRYSETGQRRHMAFCGAALLRINRRLGHSTNTFCRGRNPLTARMASRFRRLATSRRGLIVPHGAVLQSQGIH